MPNKRISKNIHTKPSMAGESNIPDEYIENRKDAEAGELMGTISDIMRTGIAEKKKRVSAWTPEELQNSILDFFDFCKLKSFKPSKSSLKLWLGVSSTQYNDWENNKNDKFGDITEIIRVANWGIESQYVNRSEKYPTANLALLRMSHGFYEKSSLEITQTNTNVSPDEIDDIVAKLGLDKPKE